MDEKDRAMWRERMEQVVRDQDACIGKWGCDWCPLFPCYKRPGAQAAAAALAEKDKEIARMREALGEAFNLQETYYGNATDTHIELSSWACKYAALLSPDEKKEEP